MEPTPLPFDPSESLSYSALTLHRTCPQAWTYRYLRGLGSTRPTTALDLGSWWHFIRACEAIERGLALGSLRLAPPRLQTGDDRLTLTRKAEGNPRGGVYLLPTGQEISTTKANALAVVAAYWKTLDNEAKEECTGALGETLPERLAYMDTRWSEHWAGALADEAPVAVEAKFKKPLSTEPGGGPSNGATLMGYVDLIYLDTRRNLLVVRDHKTAKTLDAATAADDLSDSQLHLYTWGVSDLVKGWDLPPVAALSYDRVRTAKPRTPVLTQTGTLSKSVTDYDLHTYLAWCRDGVGWGVEDEFYKSGKKAGEPKWGTYTPETSVVEHLSSPVSQAIWFTRTLVPLNQNIIGAHLQSVVDTQRQSKRTVEVYDLTGSAPRNFTRHGCRWCDYAKLCRAELLGGVDGEYPLDQFGLRQEKAGRSRPIGPAAEPVGDLGEDDL